MAGRNLATICADSAVRKIPLESPNMPPDQALLKGLSPRKGRETIQLIGYSLSLFNLYHFAEGCVPKVLKFPKGIFPKVPAQTNFWTVPAEWSVPLNSRLFPISKRMGEKWRCAHSCFQQNPPQQTPPSSLPRPPHHPYKHRLTCP